MNKENLGCPNLQECTSQAPNQTNGIPKLYHADGSLQDYYEFLSNPELYEVYCEIKSNGVYLAEFEITKVKFININRKKSIASEDKLVSLDYSFSALDRLEMVSKLNSQFLHSEAEALVDYMKRQFNFDCEVRKIELPVDFTNIFDIASYDAIENEQVRTICYNLDAEDTGLPFSVMVYYEVYCPLPFVFDSRNTFYAGGVK